MHSRLPSRLNRSTRTLHYRRRFNRRGRGSSRTTSMHVNLPRRPDLHKPMRPTTMRAHLRTLALRTEIIIDALDALPAHAIDILAAHIAERVMSHFPRLPFSSGCGSGVVVGIENVHLDLPHRIMQRNKLMFKLMLAASLKHTRGAHIVVRARLVDALEPDPANGGVAHIAVRRVQWVFLSCSRGC